MAVKLTTVGVIFGGVSGEHDVSIKSAATVVSALRDQSNRKKYSVVCFYIDRHGNWFSESISEEILREVNNPVKKKLPTSTDSKNSHFFPEKIKDIDIWFPALHGPNGEDGSIQGFFKLTGKPFVGSGILGSSLGMDKIAMKAAFSSAGLPQVEYCKVYSKDFLIEHEFNLLLIKIESKLGYPCFIKPANLGSSVGITKAYNRKELIEGLIIASNLDTRMLVEKGIKARELECGVLGKQKVSTSFVGEVRYESDWYDYETKYSVLSSKVLIPAPIPDEICKKVQELSLVAFREISAEGIARVDFFYEEDKCKLWINEINTLPGFTSQSMYPMLWEASGVALSQLVARLVESARE